MQKKLYFLNEEEKNRILNLHESRTKKQYLVNEGGLGAGDYNSNPQATKKTNDIETILWNDRKNRAETLDNKCKNYPLVFEPSTTQKNLHNWFYQRTWTDLEKYLSEIKTIDQYCKINKSLIKGNETFKSFKNTIGDGLATYLYKKINFKSSWIKYFEEPLISVLKNAGFKTIDSGSNIEMADKKQEGKKIVEKPKSGKVVVLRKTYSDQIKNTLGLDPTTTLSDSDIKMIYDKLVQKGMIK